MKLRENEARRGGTKRWGGMRVRVSLLTVGVRCFTETVTLSKDLEEVRREPRSN